MSRDAILRELDAYEEETLRHYVEENGWKQINLWPAVWMKIVDGRIYLGCLEAAYEQEMEME